MRVGRDDLPGRIRHGCNLLGIFVGGEELNPQVVVLGRDYDGAEFTLNLDLFDGAAIRPIQHFKAPILNLRSQQKRACDIAWNVPLGSAYFAATNLGELNSTGLGQTSNEGPTVTAVADKQKALLLNLTRPKRISISHVSTSHVDECANMPRASTATSVWNGMYREGRAFLATRSAIP